MIKQSFLRNYSLSKIYNDLQDKKRQLNVFYVRKIHQLSKAKSNHAKEEYKDQCQMKTKKENDAGYRKKQCLKFKKNINLHTSIGCEKENEPYCVKNITPKNIKQKPFLRINELKFNGNEPLMTGNYLNKIKIKSIMSSQYLKRKIYFLKTHNQFFNVQKHDDDFSSNHFEKEKLWQDKKIYSPSKNNSNEKQMIPTAIKSVQTGNEMSDNHKLSYMQKLKLKKLRFKEGQQACKSFENYVDKTNNQSSLDQFSQI